MDSTAGNTAMIVVWGGFGFQMFSQGGYDLGHRPTLESLLLGPSPLIWLSGSAYRCRRTQVFADVIEVAQEVALIPKDFLGPQRDPLSTVAHCMDSAVHSPASLPRDMAPAPPRFLHGPEGSPIHRRGAVFGLRRDQSHFLPPTRAFALSGSRLDRAD